MGQAALDSSLEQRYDTYLTQLKAWNPDYYYSVKKCIYQGAKLGGGRTYRVSGEGDGIANGNVVCLKPEST